MVDDIIIPLRLREFKKLRTELLNKNKKRQRHWKREMRSGNRRIYVYVEDDRCIAQGQLRYDSNDPDYTIPGQRVELVLLSVLSDRRGQGLGTKLTSFLCEEARRQGFCEISLGVNKDNAVALHIYEKLGFDTLLFDGEDEHGAYVKLMKKL